MNNKLHAPNGTYDLLPREVRQKRRIEKLIMEVFEGYGYEEIETPIFEYFDVFEGEFCTISPERMFRFFDVDGRLLTLRPDLTTPSVRLASTKLSDERYPVRLSYVGHAFRNNETVYGAKLKEFTQAGIELLGVNSPEADAEVISATIDALGAAGLSDFCVEMGQVALFMELVSAAGLTGDSVERLREYVDKKDALAVKEILKDKNIPKEEKELLEELPNLFGGAEVFDAVLKKIKAGPARDAVDNLKYVYDKLCSYGYSKYLLIDLGMVPSLGYYTGIIFKGFTRHMGFSVCAGGRYDNLCAAFGTPRPATGVAIGVDRLQSVLSRGEDASVDEPETCLVCCEPGEEARAMEVAKGLRKRGLRAKISLMGDPVEEAKLTGAFRVVTAKKDGFEVFDIMSGEKKWLKEV